MLKRILCGATLLLSANISNAAVITQNFSVAEQLTEISEVVTFDLFDTIAGSRVLESVSFSLHAFVNGTADIENGNETSTLISASLSAKSMISTAFSGELISLDPSSMMSVMVNGFDGVVDYAGSSGLQLVDLSDDQFQQIVLTDAASLLAYTGTGTSTIDLNISATSNAVGGGNIFSRFVTKAMANGSVVYTFRDSLSPIGVSEPAYIVVMGMGLLAFAGYRKTKR